MYVCMYIRTYVHTVLYCISSLILLFRLIEQLSGSSTVPLEVVRMSVPVATGKGKGKVM